VKLHPIEIVPLETGQLAPFAPNPVGVFESVTMVSEGLKLVPDTTTVAPSAPEVGLSAIVAVLVTVNVADTKSEAALPVAVTA
jgi:hypothetical protein